MNPKDIRWCLVVSDHVGSDAGTLVADIFGPMGFGVGLLDWKVTCLEICLGVFVMFLEQGRGSSGFLLLGLDDFDDSYAIFVSTTKFLDI